MTSGPPIIEHTDPPEVLEVARRLLDADPAMALAIERGHLEETDSGVHVGDPSDQPENPAPHDERPPPPGFDAAGLDGPPVATAAAVIARAQTQVGIVEQGSNRTPYGAWYGLDGEPWCAMFVSYCFFHEGLPLPASTAKGYAYTPAGRLWFEREGQWGHTPQLGANVFFRFPDGPARTNHVGIVTGFGPGWVDTIEGNTSDPAGDGVWRRRRSAWVVGYGYPTFADSTRIGAQEEDMPKARLISPATGAQSQHVYIAWPDGTRSYLPSMEIAGHLIRLGHLSDAPVMTLPEEVVNLYREREV